MWYQFRQNNSGGRFHYDKAAGIGQYVYIEANSPAQALSRAEDIGLYFDGVEDGSDCECCGDRWSRWYEDESEVPSYYGTPLSKNPDIAFWDKEDAIYLHHLEGPFTAWRPA